MKIRLGSRKSQLALWQTRHIAALLEAAHPGLTAEIITMDTLGDQILDKSIPEIGGKGVFTAELEQALLVDAIDMAVHSLKDLPTELGEDLEYAGSPRRANPTDSLISQKWASTAELPENAVIGTGSLRRRAELSARHPGFEFHDLRGNIGTRLQKLQDSGFDAIVMATAALDRLELDLKELGVNHFELDPMTYVPAVGQGAIGIEVRRGRDDIRTILEPIFDPETVAAVRAERIVMNQLEGGCSVPLGVYCARDGDDENAPWRLHAWASSPDGRQVLEHIARGDDPAQLAHDTAARLIADGAREILGRN